MLATVSDPPRRGRRPQYDRGEILDAASEMLVFRGYQSTRYSDVSEASGVPVGSLQHYYPSIEVLRREALKHKVRAELAQLEDELAELEDPWEKIRHIIVSSISLEPTRRRGGWVLWLEYWRAAAHDPELAADTREVDAAWLGLAATCVAEGVSSGLFRVDGTPQEVAVTLHAMLDGLGIGLAIEHPPEQAAQAISLVERAMRRMLFSV
jgi:AcrR family transcriptional regulator